FGAPGGMAHGPPPGYPAPMVAAPPAKSSSHAGCILAAVAVLVLLVLGGGVGAFMMLRADYSAPEPKAVSEPSPVAGGQGVPTGGPEAAPEAPAGDGPQGDYFANAPAVGQAIGERFSPQAELLELVLY